MSARRVILWRHGRTAFNIAGRIQGSTDIPLDEVGLAQVTASAQYLAAVEKPVIVSSDLTRAQQTAQALAALVHVPVTLDPRFRERPYGLWEGLTGEEIKARWPEEFEKWRLGRDIPEVGMETRREAGDRVCAAVEELAAVQEDGTTLVIASHGGALVCGITHLLGLKADEWMGMRVMSNACWTVLDPNTGRAPAWRCSGFNLGPEMMSSRDVVW